MTTIAQRTPEGIVLRRRVASAGTRFTAATLDLLVILTGYLMLLLSALVVLSLDVTGLSGVVVGVLIGGVPLCLALYHFVFHALWRGQTPGKRIVGLRVVSADGEPPTTAQHLLRSVLWPVDAMFPPLPFGWLGLGLIVCTQRHQRLGDIVAGTLVVCEDDGELPEDPYADKRWDRLAKRVLVDRPGLAARLDREDLEFLRSLLARRGMGMAERKRLFVAAAEYYRARLGLGPFQDARAFLGELYLFVRDRREQRAA